MSSSESRVNEAPDAPDFCSFGRTRKAFATMNRKVNLVLPEGAIAKASTTLLIAGAVLTFGACGSGSDDAAPREAPGAGEHVYALATGVCGPDSCQTYLGTTNSIEPRKVDVREDGIELEGFVYPFRHGDFLFVPGGESPTLTRYTVRETGELLEGPTLSFAGVGHSGVVTAGRARVVDEEKAYVFDEAGGVVLLWNPKDMSLLGEEIDISIIHRDGYDAFVVGDNAARRRGDLLFVPVGWSDSVTYEFLPVAGMLIIDTARDEVVKLIEDSRCPALESSIVTPDGDIYYGFPSAAGMLDVNVRDPSFPACSLRIRGDETEFDPDYFLNVSELTGGRIGCCAASGGGDIAYIQVLHEERTGLSDRAELFGAAHNDWRLWRVDLGARRAEEVTTLPWFGTSGVTVFETSEGVLVPILTFGGESGGLFSNVERWTTLVNLTHGPEPTPTVTVDGNLLFFDRMR